MVGQSLVLLQNWGTFFRIYLAVLHRSNIMCSYLWNVFISLDTEAGVTLVGDWSKVDLVALYFIPAHYNIFLQQRHLYAHAAYRSYESEETSVENSICWKYQWQFNWWRADRQHQRHVFRLRNPFPFLCSSSVHFIRWFFFFIFFLTVELFCT